MLRQPPLPENSAFSVSLSRPTPGRPSSKRQCALPREALLLFSAKPQPSKIAAWPFRVFCEDVLSEAIDDLTVTYEENGQTLIKELDKVILSKGAWTTIIFRYQEWRPQTSNYGPDKYVIRRYKKVGGEYRPQSKFNISSADQARKIIEALQTWISESEEHKEK